MAPLIDNSSGVGPSQDCSSGRRKPDLEVTVAAPLTVELAAFLRGAAFPFVSVSFSVSPTLIRASPPLSYRAKDFQQATLKSFSSFHWYNILQCIAHSVDSHDVLRVNECFVSFVQTRLRCDVSRRICWFALVQPRPPLT